MKPKRLHEAFYLINLFKSMNILPVPWASRGFRINSSRGDWLCLFSASCVGPCVGAGAYHPPLIEKASRGFRINSLVSEAKWLLWFLYLRGFYFFVFDENVSLIDRIQEVHFCLTTTGSCKWLAGLKGFMKPKKLHEAKKASWSLLFN